MGASTLGKAGNSTPSAVSLSQKYTMRVSGDSFHDLSSGIVPNLPPLAARVSATT